MLESQEVIKTHLIEAVFKKDLETGKGDLWTKYLGKDFSSHWMICFQDDHPTGRLNHPTHQGDWAG